MLIITTEHLAYQLDKDTTPAASVPSGETVRFETCDCFENQITTPDDTMEALDWERINPVTGPLFVEGAVPGDILAVDILSIDIEDQIAMITGPEMGVMGDELTESVVKVYPIQDDYVLFEGYKIPLRKMVGVIGTAPAGEPINSGVPADHGGNMDCTKVAQGATLYLPVNVPGALLSLGDLHATMGDGEVAVCGGEVAGQVDVRVRVIKGLDYPVPTVVDTEDVVTISSRKTLDEAAVHATKNMVHIVQDALGMDMAQATFLLTLAGDLKVCQIVDPQMTMRMELPRSYFHGKNPFETN